MKTIADSNKLITVVVVASILTLIGFLIKVKIRRAPTIGRKTTDVNKPWKLSNLYYPHQMYEIRITIRPNDRNMPYV